MPGRSRHARFCAIADCVRATQVSLVGDSVLARRFGCRKTGAVQWDDRCRRFGQYVARDVDDLWNGITEGLDEDFRCECSALATLLSVFVRRDG